MRACLGFYFSLGFFFFFFSFDYCTRIDILLATFLIPARSKDNLFSHPLPLLLYYILNSPLANV